MSIHVRQARASDAPLIREMLIEAARWVDALGVVMWSEGELAADAIAAEAAAGQFFVAEADGVPAGALRFQHEDLLFWPDIPQGESAFVHRIVVRRAFKKTGVSQAMLAWAAERTRSMGRRYLRLDCDADRPKLRMLYEDAGFRVHSYRQVGPYYVARYEIDLGAPPPRS